MLFCIKIFSANLRKSPESKREATEREAACGANMSSSLVEAAGGAK
jgi:hypothetical protein